MANQNALRDQITRTLIGALERGGLPPWRRPWSRDPNCGHPVNVISKKPYRGINPLLLQVAAEHHGFHSKYWATFKQWSELGGQVMRRPDDVPKGQWGTTVVFYKPLKKTIKEDDGQEREESFAVMRSYTVFNLDQVEGEHLDHLRAGQADEKVSQIEGFLEARNVVDATGADIRHGGDRAYYRPLEDFIQMPPQSTMGVSEYYETLFHELVHWSEARSDWDGPYALGELIAEIGACYLCAEVGVPQSEDLENHAAYLKSWLRAMRSDSSYILTAAARASKAVDHILSFSRATEPEEAVAM